MTDQNLPPQQPTPPVTPSKLVLRSEVLAVLAFWTTIEQPTKQDKLRQVKRLADCPDRLAVLNLLLRELQRAPSQKERAPRLLQALTELMMELGRIDLLQEPLWTLIKTPQVSDDVKDVANLVLRHLGDDVDPELYLDYLEDPLGLINRETQRMLEVSLQNPEALMDFLDFIVALPQEEQLNLLDSLQQDYEPASLVHLYTPLLLTQPNLAVILQLIRALGQTRKASAALVLSDYQRLTGQLLSPEEEKALKRALGELKLAGVYKADVLQETRVALLKEALDDPTTLCGQTQPHRFYATLRDGLGNQGLLISRQWPNGDLALVCVALNDLHGVMDCFGFYQLSPEDFERIVQKFHEDASKMQVPLAYAQTRLAQAETKNLQGRFRIPYEFTCWKPLLGLPQAVLGQNLEPAQPELLLPELNRPQLSVMTQTLYQHPDVKHWFLESGDWEALTPVLEALTIQIRDYFDADTLPELETALNWLGPFMQDAITTVLNRLKESGWLDILALRLTDAAFLLHCQNTPTFAQLAATEAFLLLEEEPLWPVPAGRFTYAYAQRSIEEHLLAILLEKPAAQSLWQQTLTQFFQNQNQNDPLSALSQPTL